MQKIPFTLIIFGMLFSSLHAQKPGEYAQENLLKTGLLGPQIAYEIKLSNSTTMVTETGLSFSFGYGGNEIGWLTEYALYAGVSPRYYYNFDNRLEEGKSVKKFSGNFVSLFTRAYLHEILSSMNDPNQYLIGPTWGIQRNLGKGWYFNFQVGAGASISEQETVFTPLLGADIGFQL